MTIKIRALILAQALLSLDYWMHVLIGFYCVVLILRLMSVKQKEPLFMDWDTGSVSISSEIPAQANCLPRTLGYSRVVF